MTDRVAQVRSVYEAINRGDYAVIGKLVEPEFEWYPNPGELDSTIRRDPEQAIARIRDFVGAFGDFRTDVEEVRDLGELVVAAVRHSGTPAGTSDQVERREAHLWTFAGERAVSLHEYPTLDAALDAASGSARG